MTTRTAVVIFALCLVVLYGCDSPKSSSQEPSPGPSATSNLASSVQEFLKDELILGDLETRIQPINRSLANLRLPDGFDGNQLFVDDVRSSGIAVSEPVSISEGSTHFTILRFEKKKQAKPSSSQLWDEILSRFSYVTWSKVHLTKLVGNVATANVQVVGKGPSGEQLAVRATVGVEWDDLSAPKKARISSWETEQATLVQSGFPWFENVTESKITNAGDFQAVHFAPFTEQLKEVVKSSAGALSPDAYSSLSNAFPRNHMVSRGVCVVDVNNDGRDDIFLANDEGPDNLLVSQENGSFVDEAPKRGLGSRLRSSAAMFADFDNDGDQDAFIGSWSHRCRYYENQNGYFVSKPLSINNVLPRFVSSFSVVDFNNDGLLDVYVCTYGYEKALMNEAELRELEENGHAETHMLNQNDVPNMLLKNIGNGQFVVADSEKTAAWRVHRRSFQAVWSDYDGDGDADVYIANDYAPNNLLRNDSGKLVDITDDVTSDQGSGMGASWGDYNEDGRPDIYVSNMHSSAGARVSQGLPGVDRRFLQSARGNSLFENQSAGFAQVAGSDKDSIWVQNAGWSWAGQFVDINLDGWLDIYVTNGYFTPPPVASREFARDY